MYRIVFSDIDGTLLNGDHVITSATQTALETLKNQGIPFALVSARSPAAMAPIRERYALTGPQISFSGALILDAQGQVVHSCPMPLVQAQEIIGFVEQEGLDAAWALYSAEDWWVRFPDDPRVAMEAGIVGLQPTRLPWGEWPGDQVYKVLCICNPVAADGIEGRMKERFPHLSIVRSGQMMLEIMMGGVNKGLAVKRLCAALGIHSRDAMALGDHYNDLDMLKAVGRPVVMGNAPEEIKKRFDAVTADNEHDGVARALERWIFSSRG